MHTTFPPLMRFAASDAAAAATPTDLPRRRRGRVDAALVRLTDPVAIAFTLPPHAVALHMMMAGLFRRGGGETPLDLPPNDRWGLWWALGRGPKDAQGMRRDGEWGPAGACMTRSI